VGKIETRGKETRKRRALRIEEFHGLMSVACDKHRLIYMTAAVTGLRRSEIEQLQWGDVHLDASPPYLVARAATTKNKKEAIVALSDELVSMLRAARPTNARIDTQVIRIQPKLRWMMRDLKAANIPYKNERGEQADLHSLRYTFNTLLAIGGASERVRQAAMRHSDPKLTANVYTDVSHLPTAVAVASLPQMLPDHLLSHYSAADTQIAPQATDFSCPELSQGDETREGVNQTEHPQNKEESRSVARADSSSQSKANGSGSRIRTYDLVINSHPLYR
jgi:hypothetical protein